MEEEEKKEEMSVEMSSHVQDLTHEMAVALEAINKRLEKLEEAPAAQPDRVLPKQEFNAKKNNPNLKGVDRAFDIINSQMIPVKSKKYDFDITVTDPNTYAGELAPAVCHRRRHRRGDHR